ncbi:MAG: VTT domain-containing protein [Cloacibacterium normanense]|nr:VTT domain-containing protein [Cloacibacterium normanense]HCO19698.1 cytochrome O ubiquinol oxidase [Flavobacteriaceae bacterium]
MELLQFILDFLGNPLLVLTEIIRDYGIYIYLFLFLVIFVETGVVVMPFLPGDSLLFAVGLIASTTGQIDIYTIIPLLVLAALLGDNLNYFIGKKFGDFVQSKERILFLKKSHIEDTEKYFAENGGKTVILARFIPIVRTIAPFVAGAGEMKYRTYLLYCITGAFIWVSSITLLGYFLGNIEWVKLNFEKFVLGIVFISVLPIIFKAIKRK